MADKDNSQIKSKQRVVERGEVFTAEREVNAMLDLVKQETERIDSRFLEPACGNGNFLVEIIRRKLQIVRRTYTEACGERMDHEAADRDMVQAVSSIYGIDIMLDNVAECRERLISTIAEWYNATHLDGRELNGELLDTVAFILQRNILWGDALTLCTPDDNKDPIIFSEWGFIGNMVKRRDYTLDMLLRPRSFEGDNLFSDLGDEVFIPEPCAEFSPVNYLKIYTQNGDQQ